MRNTVYYIVLRFAFHGPSKMSYKYFSRLSSCDVAVNDFGKRTFLVHVKRADAIPNGRQSKMPSSPTSTAVATCGYASFDPVVESKTGPVHIDRYARAYST